MDGVLEPFLYPCCRCGIGCASTPWPMMGWTTCLPLYLQPRLLLQLQSLRPLLSLMMMVAMMMVMMIQSRMCLEHAQKMDPTITTRRYILWFASVQSAGRFSLVGRIA